MAHSTARLATAPKLGLGKQEAVALAHALVARLAEHEGIRALAIKGPVSDHYEFRKPRVSADADVWIEPRRFDEMRLLLEAHGWRRRVARETPSLLPRHSVTYIHEAWPCDVDLHRSFPGFFGNGNDAFDYIWSCRHPLEVAHIRIWIPAKPAAAVIALLHALRSTTIPRHLSEKKDVASVIAHGFSLEEQDEFYRVARAGGAIWVLRDLLTELALGELVTDATAADQRAWNLYRTYGEHGSTIGWWSQLQASPWSQRPLLLLRAVWVRRVEIPRNNLESVPSRASAVKYNLDRWRRGLRATARYIRKR